MPTAKAATATISLAFLATDPVGNELVASLSKPEKNLAGVAYDAGVDVCGKRIEMLKEIVSRLSRVIVPIISQLTAGRWLLFRRSISRCRAP